MLCIDCVNSILDDYEYSNRQYLEMLFEPIYEINERRRNSGQSLLTVILCHHTNAEGNTKGGVALESIVTNVFMLKRLGNGIIGITEKYSRSHSETKSCKVMMAMETDNSVRFDIISEDIQHDSISSTLGAVILAELKQFGKNDVRFDELLSRLRKLGYNQCEKYIRNVVGAVGNKTGLLIMANGCNWDIIRINQRQMQEA